MGERIEDLVRLSELKEKGVLSEEEFLSEKEKILNSDSEAPKKPDWEVKNALLEECDEDSKRKYLKARKIHKLAEPEVYGGINGHGLSFLYFLAVIFSPIPFIWGFCTIKSKYKVKSLQGKSLIFFSMPFLIIFLFSLFAIFATSGESGLTPSAVVSESGEKAKAMPTTAELKNISKQYKYDDLKRNPNSFEGKFIKEDVIVVQKITDTQWRAYTKNNFPGYDLGQEFYIFDRRSGDIKNIIENDSITVYGVYRGVVEITRALTKINDKIPAIEVYALDLIDKNSL